MSLKPYSFRYPYDIRTTLAPWREELGANYEQVIHTLHDRDRAIEDHLSLDVAQGILGQGNIIGAPVALTGVNTDIPGMTVTFTVPTAPRKLKLTAYLTIVNADVVARDAFMRVLDENNTVLITESAGLASAGSTAPMEFHRFNTTLYTTATPGTHTWRVQASINGAAGSVNSATAGDTFLTVEDAGPLNRT